MGEIDPLSAVIAIASFAVSLWFGRHAARSLQIQESNLTEAATRLSDAVLQLELPQRDLLIGGSARRIDIIFRCRREAGIEASNHAAYCRLEGIFEFFEETESKRLVITGDPGAGKTVTALTLLLGLLARRTEGQPVPVRFSMSSWDTHQPLVDWLVSRLERDYRVRRRTAQALVATRRVMPILDGLDEMDADGTAPGRRRAAQALRQLNLYQDANGHAPLILTCRSAHYNAVVGSHLRLEHAAHLQALKVTSRHASTYITRRSTNPGRWTQVLRHITESPLSPLARSLTNPWRLNLAASIYEHRDPVTSAYVHNPRELMSASLNTQEAIRDHLLGLFLPIAATQHWKRSTVYSPDHVHVWLATLAAYLEHNSTGNRRIGDRSLSSTDITLHELWPLGGYRTPRFLHAVLSLITWISLNVVMASLSLEFDTVEALSYIAMNLFGVCLIIMIYRDYWPTPRDFDLRQLRSHRARLKVALLMALGSLCMAFGMHVLGTPGLGVEVSVPIGSAIGLISGLMIHRREVGVEPRDPIRADHIFGLSAGLLLGVSFGVPSSLVVSPPSLGISAGLALGFCLGVQLATAGVRYFMLLLSTRRRSGRWLPWRLGRFLDWACRAGLLRTAGAAYQFRHRELQDWFAEHSSP